MATNRNVVYIHGDYNIDALELAVHLMNIHANDDGDAEYITCGRMKANTEWPDEIEKPIYSIVESNYQEFTTVPLVESNKDYEEFTPWFIYIHYPAKYFLGYELEDLLRRYGKNVEEHHVVEAIELSRVIDNVPMNEIVTRYFPPFDVDSDKKISFEEKCILAKNDIKEELGIDYEHFLIIPARSLRGVMREKCARHFLGIR